MALVTFSSCQTHYGVSGTPTWVKGNTNTTFIAKISNLACKQGAMFMLALVRTESCILQKKNTSCRLLYDVLRCFKGFSPLINLILNLILPSLKKTLSLDMLSCLTLSLTLSNVRRTKLSWLFSAVLPALTAGAAVS